MKVRMILFGRRMLELMDRYRIILSMMTALLLSGAVALYNISSGPLHNLNDIGGWSNRALFIAMTAAVHMLLLILCGCLGRVNFARTVLRQMIVTAGFYIMLMGINHKTYAYVQVMQPVIRAMDAGGLSAGAAMQTNLSAPALLLVYLITRGPVYDMYLLKLFAIGCYLAFALLAVRAMDRRALGLRAETLLALCVILPQGFMNAACSALPEIPAILLLGAALTLAMDGGSRKMTASLACYGAACALCGVCLYALPVYIWLMKKERTPMRRLLLVPVVMALLCVPALVSGMPVVEALESLVFANLGTPAYASGAPSVVNFVPRSLVQEIPQYAPVLRHLPALDLETYDQVFYTPEHFTAVMNGIALAALAAYAGLCALVYRMKDKPAVHRVMTLVLGALLLCPNVTSGAWLAADVLCLYALLAAPKLRLPACLVLFATMCSSSYPMTEEVMLPMVYAFALCLGALCMLLDVIPMGREVKAHD